MESGLVPGGKLMGRRYFVAADLVQAYLRGEPRTRAIELLLRADPGDRAEVWVSGLALLPGWSGDGEGPPPAARDRLARLLRASSMIPVGGKALARFLEGVDLDELADFERALSSSLPSIVVVTLDADRWNRKGCLAVGPEALSGPAGAAKLPLVDLAAQLPSIYEDVQAAVWRILSSSSFILGQEVRLFEKEFADFCGVSHAVALNSGTDALHLALRALEVGEGDGVLTVSHTFAATAETVRMTGAYPLFIDIDPDDCCMSPDAVREFLRQRAVRSGDGYRDRVTGVRLKAMLPVHLYGQMADMEQLAALAGEYSLRMLEDAAQAHGATLRVNGGLRRPGSIGSAGAYSFYPAKNLGAWGDGGAFVTDDPQLADRVRKLRDHGRVSKYEHASLGWSSRMDALQAAVLRVKLPHLSHWLEARRKAAFRYSRLLEGTPGLVLPTERPGAYHVYHLYVVRLHHSVRDAVLAHLKGAGIEGGIHYPVPLHLQPAFAGVSGGQPSLEQTEAAAKAVLSLPLFPEITADDQERTVKALREALLIHPSCSSPADG